MKKAQNERRFVYGIRVRGESPIKVGVTRSLKSRIDSLQTGYHKQYIVVFAALEDNAISVEAELHLAFSEKRISGEWFDITAEDLMSEFWNAVKLADTKRVTEIGMQTKRASEAIIHGAIADVVSEYGEIAKTPLIELVNEKTHGAASKTRIRKILNGTIAEGKLYKSDKGRYNAVIISKISGG
jgi:hypothetical protein